MISRWVVILILLCIKVTAAPSDATSRKSTKPPANLSNFVYAQNGELMVNGTTYRFNAANSYNMLESRQVADRKFASMNELGVNVLRMWGFYNGDNPQERDNYLTFNRSRGSWPPQLEYPEAAWLRLDYVLYRAAQHNIKVILPLGNYWDDFGGINLITEWAGFGPEERAYYDREIFYSSARTRYIYRQYVEKMMTRVNYFSGIRYVDDPTILMWEPLNEARGRSDSSGELVANWLDWAAGLIKQYAPNHLVGDGTDGFLASFEDHLPEFANYNFDQYPFQAVRKVNGYNPEGSYFLLNCQQVNIDVCSFHTWPINWSIEEQQNPGRFSEAWIAAHVYLKNKHNIRKPLYMAEFGLQVVRNNWAELSVRDQFFADTYRAAYENNIFAVGFWHLSTANPKDLVNHLTFDVICERPQPWDATCDVIRDNSPYFVHP